MIVVGLFVSHSISVIAGGNAIGDIVHFEIDMSDWEGTFDCWLLGLFGGCDECFGVIRVLRINRSHIDLEQQRTCGDIQLQKLRGTTKCGNRSLARHSSAHMQHRIIQNHAQEHKCDYLGEGREKALSPASFLTQ